jgi:hypothetical protein
MGFPLSGIRDCAIRDPTEAPTTTPTSEKTPARKPVLAPRNTDRNTKKAMIKSSAAIREILHCQHAPACGFRLSAFQLVSKNVDTESSVRDEWLMPVVLRFVGEAV